MKAKFTFLGTGASTGVPIVGCKCATCTSMNPKDQRLRPAGLIQYENKNILIDAGPDIREQLLREKIDHLDGLLLTHSHYDHIGGLDELRVFFFKNKQPLDCLLSPETRSEIEKRYYYMFLEQSEKKSYSARFHFQEFGDTQAKFCGLDMQPVYYFQGGMEVTGFIIGDFAYLCDMKDFDESIFTKLQGVETLVISALQKQSSLMHLTLDEAIDFAKKVGAKKTYFTHIGHGMSHEDGAKDLPENIELGVDGLSFTFNTSYAK